MSYICHHGVKGQKWGVRRYQNYDGTSISKNNDREYAKKTNKDVKEIEKKFTREDKEKIGYSDPDNIDYNNASKYTVKRFIEKNGNIPVAYFDVNSANIKDYGLYTSVAIAVSKDYQGKGYGQKISKQGMEWIDKNKDKLGEIVWQYREDNIGSGKLAKSSGFVVDNERDTIDEDGYTWKTAVYKKK